MNITRAVLAGAIVWVLIFFEVSILMFGLNLTAGAMYYSIHYILSIFFVTLAAWFYFKDQKTKLVVKEGFMLGIVMIITGVVLDAVITVPLFIKTYSFFLNPGLFAGYVLALVVATAFPLKARMFKKKT